MTDKAAGVYGICLRGKAGLGREHGLPDRDGQFVRRALVRREVEAAVQLRRNGRRRSTSTLPLMKADGPPGASSNGFNENLALFNAGKCGMWIDATVAGGLRDRSEAVEGRRQGRLRARARQRPRQARQLAVGVVARGSRRLAARSTRREKFISWATSKHYTELVASKEGWANVPPGTRTSLYKNPDYLKAAPFAQMTLESINSADPTHPTVKPVPYVGVQFVAIPEFQGIGDRRRPGLLGGARRHDDASTTRSPRLRPATEAAMKKAGYIK